MLLAGKLLTTMSSLLKSREKRQLPSSLYTRQNKSIPYNKAATGTARALSAAKETQAVASQRVDHHVDQRTRSGQPPACDAARPSTRTGDNTTASNSDKYQDVHPFFQELMSEIKVLGQKVSKIQDNQITIQETIKQLSKTVKDQGKSTFTIQQSSYKVSTSNGTIIEGLW